VLTGAGSAMDAGGFGAAELGAGAADGNANVGAGISEREGCGPVGVGVKLPSSAFL